MADARTPIPVTLATLAGGVAEELFAVGMAKIAENVADVNTDPKAKRVLVLRFEMNADEERRSGDIIVTSTLKLASVKGMRVGLYYGRHLGRDIAVEAIQQTQMFPDPEPKLTVVTEGRKS